VDIDRPNIAIGRTWPVRVKRPGERRSLSRSATRALDVLEHFGQARRPLRAIEIAQALGLHPSTANQLLKTMVESAHLVFDARAKTYLPSHRLAQFSGWMVESYGGDERLRGLVRELNSATGEIVTLTTPNDLFMQVLDQAGTGPTGQPTERGLRVSVFGSAVGAAYLSALTDGEIIRLAKRARLPAAEAADVLASAARIRREGFAEGPSLDGSMWSIATPLAGEGLPAPLVLGLAGPEERVRASHSRLQGAMRLAIARWRSSPLRLPPA
jgi:DNA-binding IclR family transcriptional regulator